MINQAMAVLLVDTLGGATYALRQLARTLIVIVSYATFNHQLQQFLPRGILLESSVESLPLANNVQHSPSN